MGPTQAITVLLVDDNHTFLAAVRNFLAQLPDVQVVGEASDGAMALEQARLLNPELVLMDIAMPVMNGLEAAAALNHFARPPQIIFLTMHDGASYRDAARELGARGFVGKSEFVDDLVPLLSALVAELRQQGKPGEVQHAAH